MGYREIMQAGLECIGAVDLYAMGEVLALAEESLALIGSDYLLDVSHLGVVSSLLEGLEEDDKQAILTEMERKNLAGVQDLGRQLGLSQDLAQRAGRLALLYGPPDQVLPELEEIVGPGNDALEELKDLCHLLESTGHGKHLRLDFSIVGGMRYYNGVIFRGYVPGLAASVLAGGRYDNLLRRMGKQGEAIGFAVYLDQLERLPSESEDYDVDLLMIYGPGDDLMFVAGEADIFRKAGYTVRVERSVPPGLRYRRFLRFRGLSEGGEE
jgi:ATP phosphoribosyltransferase regulatory subunit